MTQRKFTLKDWFIIVGFLGGSALFIGALIISSVWDSVSEHRLSMMLNARGITTEALVTQLDMRTTGLKVRTQYCALSYTYDVGEQSFINTEDLGADYCRLLVEDISKMDLRYLPDSPSTARLVKNGPHWVKLALNWLVLFLGALMVFAAFVVIIILACNQIRLRRAS